MKIYIPLNAWRPGNMPKNNLIPPNLPWNFCYFPWQCIFCGEEKRSSISRVGRSFCQLLPSTSSISITQRTNLVGFLTGGGCNDPVNSNPQQPNPSSQHSYKVKHGLHQGTPASEKLHVLPRLYKLKIHLKVPGAKSLQEAGELGGVWWG